jgi:UDPglucose 6-dehydrogenase
VFGAGYVGLATAVGLAMRGKSVDLIDNDPSRVRLLQAGQLPFHEPGLDSPFVAALGGKLLRVLDAPKQISRIALICVGTPFRDSGEGDLTQLGSAIQAAKRFLSPDGAVVIRSTVPVGSMRRLADDGLLATNESFMNPEFLREGSALADFGAPARIVIGHFRDVDPHRLTEVMALYEDIPAPILTMTMEEAELVKNAANAFLALRLSFANEIAVLCEEYRANAEVVLQSVGLDLRIGQHYLKPGFGFGGSCLPKELQTLAWAGKQTGLEMHMTAAAAAANLSHQRRFARRIATVVTGAGGSRIGLLGLSFKAGTDDVRLSPAIFLAKHLLDQGLCVTAYDPLAADNARRVEPRLKIAHTAADALSAADAGVIATEWPEFRSLDWATIRGSMEHAIVFDGRRLLDGVQLESLGYKYERVGGPERITTV